MTFSAVNQKPTVAVIGGGLAGISAGSALADAGYHVELFERRPYLGGRASSYELPGTGEVVDNCQHVLLGCCTNLIDLYRRLGVADQIRWYQEITFLLPDGRSSVLRPGVLPAPLRAFVFGFASTPPERQAGDLAGTTGTDACATFRQWRGLSHVVATARTNQAVDRSLLGSGTDQRAQR